MSTYTKIFGHITESTIWLEPDATRLLWITLLVSADRHGEIMGSVPGYAAKARIDLAECRKAFECLLSPDPDSRDTEAEGRRIEKIPGGWRIINHEKYRALGNDEDRKAKAALRQKRFREKAFQDSNATVTPILASEAEAEADTDTKTDEAKEEQKEKELKLLKEKALSDSASPRAVANALASEVASEKKKELEPNYAPLHPAGQHTSGKASQVEILPSQKPAARSKNTPRSEAPPLAIPEHLQTPEFLDAWADKLQRNEAAPRTKRSSLGNWLKQLEPFTAQEAAFLVRGAMDWMGLNLPSQLASIQKLKRENLWTGQASHKNKTIPQLLEKHAEESPERVSFYRRQLARAGQRNGSEFQLGMKSESQILVEALEKGTFDAEFKASEPNAFSAYRQLGAEAMTPKALEKAQDEDLERRARAMQIFNGDLEKVEAFLAKGIAESKQRALRAAQQPGLPVAKERDEYGYLIDF